MFIVFLFYYGAVGPDESGRPTPYYFIFLEPLVGIEPTTYSFMYTSPSFKLHFIQED